ncbi:MAG: cytochrome c3 family protein [Desulfocapsaceae bacterium]|nr:cytochrome c3 family protein [Desulfocapsaceae bacterium]
MMQNRIKSVVAILLAGSFFLATNSMAAEAYDEDSYGPEAPIVWDKPTKVTFSHKVHTMDSGLTCDACHDELFTMEAGAALATGKMTMAAMAEGKFCGSCHDGNTAFATNSQCSSCHTDVNELVPEDPIVWTKPVKAVLFYHKAHTEDFGLECDACHNDTFVMQKGAAEKADNFTMKSLYEGKYCGKCHDGSTAFASDTRCNTCHIGVKGYNRMTGNDNAHEKDHKDTHAGH